ncbi:MAG TPA: PQQ-dependent sugar dehydrogenase [Vicinamibacterales bacterium]|nr:PQQ-dependent sugar dehydrogenase [Vicinamibacterales bacterium]
MHGLACTMLRHLAPFALILAIQQPQAACAPDGPATPPTDQPGNPTGEPPATGDVFTAGDGIRFLVETFARNLTVPWAMAFAPDGRIFVTERPGRVRIIQNGQVLPAAALTLTDVYATGEAGLLGIALHPGFASNRFVYLVYTANAGGQPANRLVRYREVNSVLAERAVLLDDVPGAAIHDGSRLKFGPDGLLYMTMGDAAVTSLSQQLGSFAGKILRFNDDGTTPRANPFSSPVLSYGHRNPQGIDFSPVTGELWETEHGPTGLDEVNRIRAGANYGWPEIVGSQTRPGMEPPVLFYDPSIAPSGMAFYRGTRIPAFANNLFFATLRGAHLHRVRFDAGGTTVVGEERLLEGRYGRLREVVFGPDGFLYFTTSNRDGRGNPGSEDDRILRIRPAP